ncbi:MAG: SIMPL domain-containing protein [Bacteroidota bacterium]
MKRSIAIACAFLPLTLIAQSKSFLDVPYLETSARVDTLVTPDRIYLNITIQEEDSKGRRSVEEQENRMAQKLKSIGIDLEKQLVIKDLSSSFKTYFLRSKEVLKSKQYSLVVYDGLQAGEVLMALEELGIANTYLEKTTYSKINDLELELKSKAIKKAQRKAVALTQPLGQKVGLALHIVDSYGTAPVAYAPRMKMAVAEMDMAVEAPLDVDFEKIKVETSVQVKFKLEE